MWRPTCLVHLVWAVFILLATTSCMASPCWAANAEAQKLSFQLGLEPVPDLPEFLRPLEELCIRLLDKKGKTIEPCATHVELSGDDPTKLIVLHFDLYHDSYCPCCSGQRTVDLTDDDLDLLQHYPSIEVLFLDGASITGRGLARITHLQKLRALNLRNTSITGKDLALLATLTNLQQLNLRGVEFRAEHFQPLVALNKLELLELEPWVKDEAVLEWFGQLTELRRLPHAVTTDAGCARIAGLMKLEELIADEGIEITDSGLAHLARMTQLKALWIANNPLTDAGLSHLRGMTQLSALSLDNTYVTDAGLTHLSHLTRLETLSLNRTQITDEGFRHLSRCNQLHAICLDETKFTGKGFGYLDPRTPLRDSYGEFPATSDGVKEINRLKSWEILHLTVKEPQPLLELSQQPQLKTLGLYLMADAGDLRIADCPKLEKLVIRSGESTRAMQVHALRLEALPALRELEVVSTRPESIISRGALENLRRAALRGSTNVVMLGTLTQCAKLESIGLSFTIKELDSLTGDLSSLDRLPALKNLTDFELRAQDARAAAALKLLRNAESLRYLTIRLESIGPEALEPLVTCDRLRQFRLNGAVYTRTFQLDNGKPWYSTPFQIRPLGGRDGNGPGWADVGP